jgi:hypothetical protein
MTVIDTIWTGLMLKNCSLRLATDFMGAIGDLSKTQKTLGLGSITITTRYLHPAAAGPGAIMDVGNEERHVLGHN